MSADSDWEIVNEPRISEYSGKVLQKTVIKNKDGFSLMSAGKSREKQQTFVARGKFGEFRFEASRWDLCEEKPIDTYIVYTQCFDDDEIGKKNKQLCLEHSREIEYALIHLPVADPWFENMPVKQVFFDIGKEWTDHVRVKAKDLVGYARQ